MLRLTALAAPIKRTATYSEQLVQSGGPSTVSVGPLRMRTVISSVIPPAAPGGVITVPFTYGSFRLLPTSVGSSAQLKAIRAYLATFGGLSGEFTVSTTGAVLSSSVAIPPSANATVRTLLQQLSNQSSQLSVPLPTQAVGIGARWRATTHLSAVGVELSQTYEYTLVRHEGTRLTLEVGYTQTGARQPAAFPGLPAGVTAELTGWNITGTGTTVLDLSQVIAVEGHLEAQGREEFRFDQGAQSETLDQHVKFGFDVAPG